jgi:hypothetical protein
MALTSFFLKFKSNLLVKRAFFMLNVAFDMAVLNVYMWSENLMQIYNDRPTNALSCMFLYFSQWLLHVSARQWHPQGATGFLLSYCKVQCVRRQVTESMV